MERTRPLKVIVALLAATFVLSACGGGAPRAQPTPTVPAAHLMSAEDAAELPSVEPIVPDETVDPDVVAPTAGPVEREPGPPGNPVASSFADPPAVGRYPYKVTVSGVFGTNTVEYEVEMREPTAAAGGRRQVQFWDIPNFPQEFTYLWRTDELLLERVKSTQIDGTEQNCKFDPPQLTLQLPMAVGETWETDVECDGARTKGTAEITRTERVTINGVDVDTFVIEGTSETTADGQTFTQESTTWYAPKERLFVLLHTTQSDGTNDVTTSVEALSIAPVEG